MGRAPCCDKASVKRGPWSPEEDAVLKSYIEKHGTWGNWIALPRKAGLNRCGKSCRLRWLNYLRPDIKHGGFTEEEDAVICNLYGKLGSRWSVIASHLRGRTDNDVKNYWNTKLKKKLMAREKKTPSISSSCSSPVQGSKLTPPDYSTNKFCLQPSPFVSPSQQPSATRSAATVDERSSISSKSFSEADDGLLLSESEFGLLSDILGGHFWV